MINLEKMRSDKRTMHDFQCFLQKLQKVYGADNHSIYWGDQGLMSAFFVGDIQYYDFPDIKNILVMPYNFCLWYYKMVNEKPNYIPSIIHFAGTAFKPWCGTYPIFLERFQNKEQQRSMNELRTGQAGYYYLWHEYALMAEYVLEK